ncbi:unnamed protein product [Mycena citricolor]|uniref:Cytochrome P450 n=1 Tax=Mycena citricolor TaxID=2018698 RepID=A0AAD2K0D3_9AGAR|nr:unnamed protein product [Mycena citricolor]
MTTSPVYAYFVLAIGALFVYWRRLRAHTTLRPPPGPSGLPILGNLFDMPSDPRVWETFARWSKDYQSDVVSVNVLGKPIVVLSSMGAIHDLLDRRGAIYSGRGRLTMLNELMGWDFSFGLMNYGSIVRRYRRISLEQLHPAAIKRFYPQEQTYVLRLLRRFLNDPAPADITSHFRWFVGAAMMNIIYGIDTDAPDDQCIRLAKEAMHAMTLALEPGAFLVDTFPILKHVPSWMPGAGFKTKARHWKNVNHDLQHVPFSESLKGMERGTGAAESFVSYCMTESDPPANASDIRPVATALFVAAADTSVSALGTFILAMLSNPGSQERAKSELDSVLGAGVLPTMADRPQLPYISAIVKEVLRWKVVTPLGVPHHIGVADEYEGYGIPPNSTVIPNIWALLHDEEMYEDPEAFQPERFLIDGKLNPDILDPETITFGFGRRICPGRHLAVDTLWITIASILATFDIEKILDESGDPVEPSYAYHWGIVSAPDPFPCQMKLRSEATLRSI